MFDAKDLGITPFTKEAIAELRERQEPDEDFFGADESEEAKANPYDDPNYDPFGDPQDELESLRSQPKERKIGFQAFTPVVKGFAQSMSEYAEFGDPERGGGKIKKKTVNHNERYKKYIQRLHPDAIEVRYEETWVTLWNGMKFKKDRDGFIDFSVQFHDKAEIAYQATTVGAESDHIKKLSTLKGKGATAGQNVQRWLKSGRKLYILLIDDAPGKKGVRWDWVPVGRGKFVCCRYEVTLEMLQTARDRREKLAASKAAKRKR